MSSEPGVVLGMPCFPVMVIRSRSFMELVGLRQDLAVHLAMLETSAVRQVVVIDDRLIVSRQHGTLRFVCCTLEAIKSEKVLTLE